MIASRMTLAARLAGRQMLTAQKRNCHFPEKYQGANLFFDITNKRLFTAKVILFLAIPYWIPFLAVRHQLRKASGQL